MVVVLTVYAVVVLGFVRQSASDALNQRLRGDFQWAAAMVDQTPEGGISWYEDDLLAVEEERPWLQVWDRSGELLYRSAEARTAARAGEPRPGGTARRQPDRVDDRAGRRRADADPEPARAHRSRSRW